MNNISEFVKRKCKQAKLILPQMKELITKSFLSEKSKKEYLKIIETRAKVLI